MHCPPGEVGQVSWNFLIERICSLQFVRMYVHGRGREFVISVSWMLFLRAGSPLRGIASLEMFSRANAETRFTLGRRYWSVPPNANDQLTNRELFAARSASWSLFLWFVRGGERERKKKLERRGRQKHRCVAFFIGGSVDRRISGFVTLSIFNRASGWHV